MITRKDLANISHMHQAELTAYEAARPQVVIVLPEDFKDQDIPALLKSYKSRNADEDEGDIIM